jgi:hypothetical protein
MRGLLYISTILIAAFAPATHACRQKYIEFFREKPCSLDNKVVTQECRDIMRAMRDYGNQHNKIYGGDITSDLTCQSCDGANPSMNSCTCTVSAWRFREWMHEPPMENRPKLTNGWDYVFADNGNYGWVDRVSLTLG